MYIRVVTDCVTHYFNIMGNIYERSSRCRTQRGRALPPLLYPHSRSTDVDTDVCARAEYSFSK